MVTPKLTIKKVMVLFVLALFASGYFSVAFAQSTVLNAQASQSQPHIGDSITVTLTISNVQNLFALDVTFTWDPTVLSLTNSKLNLGVELHSNGVLHGNSINTNPDNPQVGQISVKEEKVAGSYNLVASSAGASTDSFSGSGTIVTLTLKVLKIGNANLLLSSELSDKPALGGTANFIDHQDTVAPVTSVIPEFSNIAALAAFLAIATAAVILATKKITQKKLTFNN
jgi:hypothetical protein